MARFRIYEKPLERDREVIREETRIRPRPLLDRVFDLFITGLVRRYSRNTMGLVKIQAATYLVKGVKGARKAFLGAVLYACALFLLLSGFILAHIAFFAFVNWDYRAKTLTLFILGLVYFAIGLAVVIYSASQKNWMRFTGASKIVDKVTRRL